MSAGPPVLLVANRGEIACRVIRSAHALGLSTVAVFTDVDASAPHVELADVAVRIGEGPAGTSYLDPERLLDAARRTGATLVHPGYGFLSEDADFARAVQDAGLVWVGPPASAIAAMGDKAAAKARMRDAGVPVVPGFDAEAPSESELLAAAREVGVPLLVKASAGGGGRGLRRVDDLDALPDALREARSEAERSFGSGQLLLERYVTGARHIEIQILADTHGTVLHLGERDCSVQRRHQKVLEEAPGPSMTPELRAAMGQAAVEAARAVDYVGAGTVEMLLGDDGAFYFLEMNTRLQVEHPVTECVTGLDLVALQLRVALGEPLGLTQDDVALHGHAIEARLYAEDASADFLPATGTLHAWVPPESVDGVRVDHGLVAGQAITPLYDPMIAKVIAHGPDRDTARRRLLRALDHTVALGVTTNRAFLQRVLADATFAEGQATTATLSERPDLREEPEPPAALALVAAALTVADAPRPGFRTAHPARQPIDLLVGGERVQIELLGESRGVLTLRHDDGSHAVAVLSRRAVDGGAERVRIEVDGIVHTAWRATSSDGAWLSLGAHDVLVRPYDPAPAAEVARAGDGRIVSAAAGRVLEVLVGEGDTVAIGDPLLVVEAMKIETRLRADVAGTVAEVRTRAGASVSAGAVVIVIQPTDPEAS